MAKTIEEITEKHFKRATEILEASEQGKTIEYLNDNGKWEEVKGEWKNDFSIYNSFLHRIKNEIKNDK
jgi:hypothetical protein